MINTKAFWEIVRDEYEHHSSWGIYMCLASEAFKSAWNNSRTTLQQLGAEFLAAVPEFNFMHTTNDEDGASVLFKPSKDTLYITDEQRIEVRKAFINWNLERCK
jgi:hypothetical protein